MQGHLIRFTTLTLCVVSALSAEEPEARKLTENEVSVARSITAKDVLGTVSFLASDEMAGRQTPSKELTIASAFVASRFRGAGLEGLEEDGSFYQVHHFKMSQPPRERPTLTYSDGATIPTYGLLAGGAKVIDESSTIVSEADAKDDGATSVVVVEEFVMPPQAVDQPGLAVASLARKLRSLSRKKVKAVLIPCSSDSVLPELAQKLQEQPLSNSEALRPSCAVLLVDNKTMLEGRNVKISVAEQDVTGEPVRNVIGVLRGSDETLKHEAILVSAHLDHIGTRTRGDDLVNNGADDNATGVTTVIALADAFATLKVRPKRSIVFATFWGEEKGLLGSKEFAKKPSWPLKRIVANVNFEMVGRPEKDAREKAWMTGWKHSNLGPLMNAGAKRMGVEVFNRTDVGEMLYSRSDNYSLVKMGVVAHSFSAGSLHDDYHQPGDEWEKLDIPHMTRVIQGMFAGVLYLADSDVQVKLTK